jgi:hypothetical protein
MSVVTSARRRRRRALVTALVAGFALTTADTALADPQVEASCMAHEAAGISPPGSSDEFSGGMPGLHAFVQENFPDVPRGVIYSSIAHARAGSHEACE